MSKQYPNVVPYADGSQGLGTKEKMWRELYAKKLYGDEFAGGLLEVIEKLATKASLAEVQGEIAFANAPNYYSQDTPWSADTSLNHTTILSPDILWLNINGKGHKLTEQISIDISDPLVWDTEATKWTTATKYEEGQYVYATEASDKYMYICTTAGTSSTLTPTWPTEVGTTYNDGSVVWECVLNYAAAGNRAGGNFYIYALYNEEGITPTFMVSASSYAPKAVDDDMYRRVGGFHCECADIGELVPSTHKLYGWLAGDILPASVWDCWHRPVSAPEGMVYDSRTDRWVDIYLTSYTGTLADGDLRLQSVYNVTTADGTSAEAFHWYRFARYYAEIHKYMPTQQEFMSASIGSNQATNIKGSADPGTTGGHSDTANRRMVSDIGCEDMCGALWQWGNDQGGNTSSSSYSSQYTAAEGTDQQGQGYLVPARVLFGGGWDVTTRCGSRCSDWNDVPLSLNAFFGGRGFAEPVHRAS